VSGPVPEPRSAKQAPVASARGGSRPQLDRMCDDCANDSPGLNHDSGSTETAEPSPISTREKTVQFDLNTQEQEISPVITPYSPEDEDERERSHGDRDGSEGRHGERQSHRRRQADERSNGSQGSGRDRKRQHRDESPGSDASDATIELPRRLDEGGYRRGDDPTADKLESVLQSLFGR
jgi:hypothetical protein